MKQTSQNDLVYSLHLALVAKICDSCLEAVPITINPVHLDSRILPQLHINNIVLFLIFIWKIIHIHSIKYCFIAVPQK